MKSLKHIQFNKLFDEMPIYLKFGKEHYGRIVKTKIWTLDGKIQKQIVIDWDDFGLRLYDHDEMAENIYYDSEKNFEN